MGGKKKKRSKNEVKQSEDEDNGHNSSQENENAEDGHDVNTPENMNNSDIDSDLENEPKRKKKKKPNPPVETTDGKNKKSIRQAKREKFAKRQAEIQAAAKIQIKSDCLNYLSQWKHNKQNWKFMKAKQVWLYKNKFSDNMIPNDYWPLLLEYFESSKGNIRNMLLTDANKIIKQMDDWTETSNTQDEEPEENAECGSEEKSVKPNETIYKRARELIQFLQE